MKRSHRFIALLAALFALAVAPSAQALDNRPDVTWMTNGVVHALAQVGNTIYVGGEFTEVRSSGGINYISYPVQNLAAFDATTGKGIPSWTPAANAVVYALDSDPAGTMVIAGGEFSTLNGESASRIGALDPLTGAHLTSFKAKLPNAANAGVNVRALATTSDHVYIGGAFGSVNGVPHTRLAAVNYAGTLYSEFTPSANATVRDIDLASNGSDLYLSGNFQSVNGSAQENVARIDRQTGALGTWKAAVPVKNGDYGTDMAEANGQIFLGFSGSQHFDSYLTSDGSQVWRLGTGGDVKSVEVWQNKVVFGGHFGSVKNPDGGGTDLGPRIAAVNFNGFPNSEGWDPSINGTWDGPYEFLPSGNQLYVGGAFKNLSGRAQHWFARFTQ